jgi:hypothetical protein
MKRRLAEFGSPFNQWEINFFSIREENFSQRRRARRENLMPYSGLKPGFTAYDLMLRPPRTLREMPLWFRLVRVKDTP